MGTLSGPRSGKVSAVTTAHTSALPRGTESLPVMAVVGEVQAALRDGTTAVLVAPPGAGKTTGIPLALLDAPWLRGARILLLEPRRLAARAAASRMASLRGDSVGGTIGWRMRGDTRVGPSTSGT